MGRDVKAFTTVADLEVIPGDERGIESWRAALPHDHVLYASSKTRQDHTCFHRKHGPKVVRSAVCRPGQRIKTL